MLERRLVKRRWTDSSSVIKPVLEGDQTHEQYLINVRTYALKALTTDEISYP